MISPEVSTISSLVFYFFSSLAGLLGIYFRNRILCIVGCWLACCAFLCQTLFLALGIHRYFPDGLSLGAYIQLFAWFILFCSIGMWFWLKQQSFLLFSSQFCLLLYLLSIPWIYSIVYIPKSLEAPFYLLHIVTLFLFIALITLGFIAGILFLFLSNRIKNKKKILLIWNEFPALSILDKINSYCVLISFPLYTIGIITGIIWSLFVYKFVQNLDPKIVTSLVVWILLAILFHNRMINVWKGRKPAWWLISIFLISIFSLTVINLFTCTMHNFFNS